MEKISRIRALQNSALREAQLCQVGGKLLRGQSRLAVSTAFVHISRGEIADRESTVEVSIRHFGYRLQGRRVRGAGRIGGDTRRFPANYS
jgi:hypothetical protein